MQTMPPSHCHGPGCVHTNLIKAHIMPQWVGRFINSPYGANVLVTPTSKTQKYPGGIFDPNILCADCDHYLGTNYDAPASEIFKKLRITRKNMNMRRTRFTKRGIDCDTLCRFFLSILWRSSISTRPECKIHLGSYETEVRDTLFHIKPISILSGLGIVMVRYISNITDATRLYTLPETLPRFLGHNVFGFALAGFRIVVKLDPAPFPPEWQRDILNCGKNVLHGRVTNFESSLEGRKAHRMVLDAEQRRRTP